MNRFGTRASALNPEIHRNNATHRSMAGPSRGQVTVADAGSTERGNSAQLVFSRGAHAGAGFAIEAECTTIGRDSECDIVLTDTAISRRHAELRRSTDHAYTLIDTGSLNGTYLNRHPVDKAELADGDEIWIGKARFTFHVAAG